MTTIPDHYAALGIDPTADPEVITAAYRALAKKFHPDTGAADGTASAERFDQIQKAYEVLRTPESRHAYDLELLEATERELAEHIAAKRRVVVRERAQEKAAPPPDLGDIRPEPSMPPKAKPAARGKQPRSLLPFAIPLLLVMLVGAGAAWTLLPAGPEAPPLPGAMKTAKQDVVVAEPAPAPQPSASAEVKTTPPAPAPQSDSASAEAPVFGSTGAEESPPQIVEAAASPEPAPPAAASTVAKSETPVFGSATAAQSPAVAPAPQQAAPQQAAPQQAAPQQAAPPLPKKKPAPPVKQAQKPVTQPKPKKPVQQQAQLQPRARLQYQDPPQYYPEPDGYPPPGYEPPGYGDEPYPVPPGYELPPPGFRPPGNGPYRLVIWERQPGRQATAWSAGVVFKSMGKCTRQGVKAVLRRTSGMDPYADNVRVWYECQRL